MKIGEKEWNIFALILFLLFILTNIPLIGFIATMVLIYATVYPSFQKGIKYGVIDILQSLIFAVAALIVIGLVLQTSSPLDINVSCSMRPYMERGDFIILKGFENTNIPTITLANYSDWRKIDVLKKPCNVTVSDRKISRLCTYGVEYNNTTIYENRENPIIIYSPRKNDTFVETGNIVHRVFAKITTPEGDFLLTKGDNNLSLDQEAGNEPVAIKQVHGQILFKIPYIGYVKLFAFGLINPPPECAILVEQN